MPWLADLVQSSEGSLDVLPVQCLCEFLLHDAADDSFPEDDEEGESKEQKAKKRQVFQKVQCSSRKLLLHICDLVLSCASPIETTEAKAASWTAAGSSVGPKGRRADDVRGSGLLPASPQFFSGGFKGSCYEGTALKATTISVFFFGRFVS